MFARLPLKTAFGAAALAAAGLMLTPAAASAQAYSYQGAPQAYGSYDNSYGYQQPYGYGYERQSGYGYEQPSGYGYDQSRYGSERAYGQDYCRSERRQRQGAGVAVGATFGAVVGSQLGARGRRTEGSVLGAVIGGALGAAVGSDSARDCNGGYPRQSQYGYDDRAYGDQYRYQDRGYGYDDRYNDRGYQYQDDRYDCRPVAVTTRDRYGRAVTRYQQTC